METLKMARPLFYMVLLQSGSGSDENAFHWQKKIQKDAIEAVRRLAFSLNFFIESTNITTTKINVIDASVQFFAQLKSL